MSLNTFSQMSWTLGTTTVTATNDPALYCNSCFATAVPAGPEDVAGPQGPQGLVGPTGPVGPIGVTGATGAPCAIGPTGPTGPTRPQGAIGATGATGPTGADGADGPIGATGAIGPDGVAGPAGDEGPMGSIAAAGAPGPDGDDAATSFRKTRTLTAAAPLALPLHRPSTVVVIVTVNARSAAGGSVVLYLGDRDLRFAVPPGGGWMTIPIASSASFASVVELSTRTATLLLTDQPPNGRRRAVEH